MKNQGKLMKKMDSSDINSMVRPSRYTVAVRPAMPVNTSAIWGVNVFPGANSAIWGTSAIAGAGTPISSAIWGTCGRSAPMQQVPKPLPSLIRSS